jgi:hypothetical protein
MQTAILVWATLRTDWNKEVETTEICRTKGKKIIFLFCVYFQQTTVTNLNYTEYLCSHFFISRLVSI